MTSDKPAIEPSHDISNLLDEWTSAPLPEPAEPEPLPFEIPEQLIRAGYRFIKVEPRRKNAIETGWPDTKNYAADDPELLDHIREGGNYGVLAVFPSVIIDLDIHFPEISDRLPRTFSVKTGRESGEGRHRFYRIAGGDFKDCTLVDPDKPHPKPEEAAKGMKLPVGEVKCRRHYCVGSGCTHPSGNKYVLIDSSEVAELDAAELEKIVGKYREVKREKTPAPEDLSPRNSKKPKTTIFDLIKEKLNNQIMVPTENVTKSGDEIRGCHPVHGCGDNKDNYSFNRHNGRFKCFTHKSGGDLLIFYAVRSGVIQCHEAGKDCLRGEAGRKLIEQARKDGLITPEEEAIRPPRLIISDDLKKDADKIVEIIVEWNDPPVLFYQAGKIVTVWRDEHGMPSLRIVDRDRLRGILAEIMEFLKVKKTKEGERLERVLPPMHLVREIYARHDIPLPACRGIVTCPVMRGDGSILTTGGYDHQTKLYYDPVDKLEIPDVQTNPEQKDVTEALKIIDEVFVDFPFEGQADKDNTLALLATPVLRPLIDGCAPFCLIDKPQLGVGATLIAKVVGHVLTGRPAPMKKYTNNAEETRKVITSTLREGAAFVIFDNVETKIDDDGLEAVLTTGLWSDRELGKTNNLTLYNNAVWCATGNNLQVGRSMPRRCYRIRMNSPAARPWQRGGFTHDPLLPWVRKTRGKILAAIFTLARYWIQAGRPKPEYPDPDNPGKNKAIPRMGSFEEWRDVIGGILVYAGRLNFLGKLEEMYTETDRDTPQMIEFLEVVFDEFPKFDAENKIIPNISCEFTVQELTEKISKPGSIIAQVLPDNVADAWIRGKGLNRMVGSILSRCRERIFSGGYILKKGKLIDGRTRWYVETAQKTLPE